MTPIQKAKEIIDRYGEYLVKEFKNEPSVDKWLATPEAAALLSGEDWKEDGVVAELNDLPIFCKDRKRGKNDVCKYPIGTCQLCQP